MTRSFNRILKKAYRSRSVQEILNASPTAFTGLTQADAQALKAALGIKTVRDLAQNRFFNRAMTVLAATGTPDFDPGPPPAWATFLASAPLDHYIQHPSGRFRLDFGPVYYRGRLDGTARVIIVGQDPAADEILGHRVFVGQSGQRVQGFLAKLGVTRSYSMLNTFLFSVFGQFDAELKAISLEQPVLSFRNTFLDKLTDENPVQALIAIGRGAQHAVANWPGSQHIPVFELTHPAALAEEELITNWNTNLAGLRAVVAPDEGGHPDPTPYGLSFQPEDHMPIPRSDLPFGLPQWHGAGVHGDRNGNKQITWTAP